MSNQFPPDDDLGPEMTPEEAFSRAMRIKLRLNREARAALKASGKSAQPGLLTNLMYSAASRAQWVGQFLNPDAEPSDVVDVVSRRFTRMASPG